MIHVLIFLRLVYSNVCMNDIVSLMSWCLTFTEDYKVTNFLEIGPNVSWKTDIHALTYHYCAEGVVMVKGREKQ